MSDRVRFDVHDRVGELVLSRPEKLNAIDREMLRQIERALRMAEGDRAVRVLILRGEGRGFCAGADLGAVDDKVADSGLLAEFMAYWHQVFGRLADSPLPSIAAVHGIAYAGGFELMQACDLAVVADDARLADQHAVYGLIPGGGGSQRLPRLIGERRAKWLMFSGVPVEPREALAAGLVNAVRPAAEVLGHARAMAAVLARRSPVATARMKEAIRLGLAAPDLGAALEIERRLTVEHMRAADPRIGLAAFAERAEPDFIGE
ncbi:enoyl-CoA hydratase/isomerase family protein [Dactylosporangium sucinum]|uniref:3-hydroxybutyryl-CoA dehydratase n=1 Tax=Dactylosporangium sucinum TaxID=1424081 RepID=A0A917UCY3_9ACTN|nr:enoyl-CoA hydratase/isomerase family protein [Dactylosporangium sucinum]GGM75379.1 3-hydroxybutyryl-CoA dehydratase [Dactylosporangium sucinum]